MTAEGRILRPFVTGALVSISVGSRLAINQVGRVFDHEPDILRFIEMHQYITKRATVFIKRNVFLSPRIANCCR